MTAKTDVLGQLNNCLVCYQLGLAAICLFEDERVYPLLSEAVYKIGEGGVVFDKTPGFLQNPRNRKIALSEFEMMILRSFVRDIYQVVTNYCHDTQQVASMRAEPWYQFTRMMRNSVSHDGKFKFRPDDLALLPVIWKGKTITLAMAGTELNTGLFNHGDIMGLFQEIQAFITTLN